MSTKGVTMTDEFESALRPDSQSEQSSTAHKFDAEAFLEWLDEYDGSVLNSELEEQWPNFPMEKMAYQTCPIVDGELAYYQWDLRQIAKQFDSETIC